MIALLAQGAAISTLHLIIIGIVIVAAVGIAFAVARAAGVAIPPVIATIIWIVVIAAVAIIAIKVLMGLL